MDWFSLKGPALQGLLSHLPMFSACSSSSMPFRVASWLVRVPENTLRTMFQKVQKNQWEPLLTERAIAIQEEKDNQPTVDLELERSKILRLLVREVLGCFGLIILTRSAERFGVGLFVCNDALQLGKKWYRRNKHCFGVDVCKQNGHDQCEPTCSKQVHVCKQGSSLMASSQPPQATKSHGPRVQPGNSAAGLPDVNYFRACKRYELNGVSVGSKCPGWNKLELEWLLVRHLGLCCSLVLKTPVAMPQTQFSSNMSCRLSLPRLLAITRLQFQGPWYQPGTDLSDGV